MSDKADNETGKAKRGKGCEGKSYDLLNGSWISKHLGGYIPQVAGKALFKSKLRKKEWSMSRDLDNS